MYAFSDLKGMGEQGLHPAPSVRTLLFQQYLISRDSTFPLPNNDKKKTRSGCEHPAALYNNKKNLDLNNSFHRPFVHNKDCKAMHF